MDLLIPLITEHFVLVLLTAGILLALMLRTVTVLTATHARERSRREIAAYIAAGSITPEHGERLMRAEISGGPPVP